MDVNPICGVQIFYVVVISEDDAAEQNLSELEMFFSTNPKVCVKTSQGFYWGNHASASWW